MSVGRRIKERRKELKMSAEQLADMIGVSPATIYRYENGHIANMGTDKLEVIARALSIEPKHLMGWSESEPETQYARENYNGLNAEEARQFAKGISKAAMDIAILYDSLDEHGQEILNAIASIEYSRIELAHAALGIAELDRIGAKRLGTFAGLPHYEMGNPAISSAKYFSRAERAELEKEETESK